MVPNVRGKARDPQWTFVFVPHQVVHHTSHVPSLLRVQDPQHRLCGPDQREPVHRDQRQCGHICAGALHRQREFCRNSGSGWEERRRGQGLIMTLHPLSAGLTPLTAQSFFRFSLPWVCVVSLSLFPLYVINQTFLFPWTSSV